jgi:hypothetical protein
MCWGSTLNFKHTPHNLKPPSRLHVFKFLSLPISHCGYQPFNTWAFRGCSRYKLQQSPILLNLISVFVVSSTEVRIQGLAHSRQELCHLCPSHSPSNLLISLFHLFLGIKIGFLCISICNSMSIRILI